MSTLIHVVTWCGVAAAFIMTCSAPGQPVSIPSTQVQQAYSIQELPPLPGGLYSEARGINDAGVIVGQAHDGVYFPAVRWIDGVAEPLGILPSFPPHDAAAGWSVNNKGQVVGSSYRDTSMWTGLPFVWEDHLLRQLPIPADLDRGIAFSINEAGQIAGAVWLGDLGGMSACVWTPTTGGWVLTLLKSLGGDGPFAFLSFAFDINNTGVMVGVSNGRACVWEGAGANPIAVECPPVGSPLSAIFGINNVGRIAGAYVAPDMTGGRSFLGNSCGDLGSLGGYTTISVHRVNDAGVMVGHAYNGAPSEVFSSSAESRAIVWRYGAPLSLNDLVRPVDGAWNVRQAWDINGRGAIVGFGNYAGEGRAFVMTPRTVRPVR